MNYSLLYPEVYSDGFSFINAKSLFVKEVLPYETRKISSI